MVRHALNLFACTEENRFVHHYRTTNYVTRASETNPLNVPRITSVHSEQSILYRGGIVWNNIPPDIRDKSYDTFKNKFKTLLLSQQLLQ